MMFCYCAVAHHRSRGTVFPSRASLTLTGDREYVDYRQINKKRFFKKKNEESCFFHSLLWLLQHQILP